MNKAAEKLSEWFGSAPFIAIHIIWFTAWLVFKLPQELLTLIVSLEAIFLSLFILRAERVQGERMEKYTKQAVKDTKEDLELSRKVLKEISDLRYQK